MLWLLNRLTIANFIHMWCRCAGSPGVHALDPLRLTVAVSGWGFSGQAIAAALDVSFSVVPELATQQACAKDAIHIGTLAAALVCLHCAVGAGLGHSACPYLCVQQQAECLTHCFRVAAGCSVMCQCIRVCLWASAGLVKVRKPVRWQFV